MSTQPTPEASSPVPQPAAMDRTDLFLECLRDGYNMLMKGDLISKGDEVLRLHDRQWMPLPNGWDVGHPYDSKDWPPIRRKIPAQPTAKLGRPTEPASRCSQCGQFPEVFMPNCVGHPYKPTRKPYEEIIAAKETEPDLPGVMSAQELQYSLQSTAQHEAEVSRCDSANAQLHELLAETQAELAKVRNSLDDLQEEQAIERGDLYKQLATDGAREILAPVLAEIESLRICAATWQGANLRAEREFTIQKNMCDLAMKQLAAKDAELEEWNQRYKSAFECARHFEYQMNIRIKDCAERDAEIALLYTQLKSACDGYSYWKDLWSQLSTQYDQLVGQLTAATQRAETVEKELAALRAMPDQLLDVQAICEQRDAAVKKMDEYGAAMVEYNKIADAVTVERDTALAERDELRARMAVLETALGIYSKPENWDDEVTGGGGEDESKIVLHERTLFIADRRETDYAHGWEIADAALKPAKTEET